jgi:putative spermidine/putrescine transport system substrate-binding protein
MRKAQWLLVFVIAAAAAWRVLAPDNGYAQGKKLTVVTFGGSYEEAIRQAFWKPYTQKTGVTITPDTWNGEIGKVRAMVEAGKVTWDLIVADYEHAIVGCEQGFLVPISKTVIGDPADYLAGALHKCGFPSDVYAFVFAYNEDRIPAAWGTARPKTLTDVWDVKKFPGKRGFRKDPKYLLEAALVADGVASNKVYEVLSTPAGVDRALAKLGAIKEHIVFWSKNAQPPQLLADGEVAITSAPNGRIDAAIRQDGKRFVIIWDRQIYAPDVWIVPKGPNGEEAMKLLEFMAQPEVLATQTKYIAYGPARKSAMKYVERDVLPYLPTTPQNLTTAIASDEGWWADHYEEMLQRFNAWLAK